MKQRIISLLAVAVLSAVTTLPAFAEDRHERGAMRMEGGREMSGHVFMADRHGGRGWAGERDIRHFGDRHFPMWRSGAWHHGRHDGRLGWWWVVGGMWYFYPEPIYPYPDPYIPPYVVVQSAPQIPAVPAPPQSWYYCEASKEYYPYVATCPAGWKAVPAMPATPPATPASPPAK